MGGLTDIAQVELPSVGTVTSLDADALTARLQHEVRGQHHAVATLARRLREHLGRVRPRRPLTLFALGPTGVGKTLAAHVAASALADPALVGRGARWGFLRLDMSEFQEAHRVSQLFGSPQGYVGYGDGAPLTRTLGANPRTFVLFDEIEKAHPDVLVALMNAMDAGRLGDPSGRSGSAEVDCRQAVFYFTSNLEADGVLDELGVRGYEDPSRVDAVCRRRLRARSIRPELLGRIRSFLVFDRLDDAATVEMAALSVARVVEEYGMTLRHVDAAVVTAILAAADHAFGARPVEYVATALLSDGLVDLAAAGHRGEVTIRPGPDGVRIERRKPEESVSRSRTDARTGQNLRNGSQEGR